MRPTKEVAIQCIIKATEPHFSQETLTCSILFSYLFPNVDYYQVISRTDKKKNNPALMKKVVYNMDTEAVVNSIVDNEDIMLLGCYIIGDGLLILLGYDFIFCTEEAYEQYIVPNIKLLDRVTQFGYVCFNDGMYTKYMNVNKCELGLENYNDDIPNDRINKFIGNKDSSGLIILYGEPGCGKSYYIRSLIYNNPETEFLVIDASMLRSITNADFISYLTDHKGNTFIIEDCEDLLRDRNSIGGNSAIATILNLSDGLLGDSLNLKFICTFNSELTSIDKAILRKGRLHVLYEFKKLNKEKAIKLAKKLNKDIDITQDIALCEIYNTENTGTASTKARIGFN